MQGRGAGKGLRVAGWVLGLLGVVLIAGLVYGMGQFRGVTVRGDSMGPTYVPGDRLVVEQVESDEIRRGDLVLVTMPELRDGATALRRVIGTGGDEVACCDGGRGPLTVNGRPLDEPYLKDGEAGAFGDSYEVKVPEGRLFLLGDDRANSNDSRYSEDGGPGTAAVADVRGRVREGDSAAPLFLAAAGLGGGVSLLLGIGLGIGGYVTGRRARRQLQQWPPAAAPWQAWPGNG